MFAGEHAKTKLAPGDETNPARQHWSIRTLRWRYVRYNNGQEELYDHDADPHEWTNLAGKPEYAATLAAHRERLLARIPKSLTNPTSAKPDAEGWKDAFLMKYPGADANHDGVLSWPEYKAYKARLDAGKTKNVPLQ